MKDPKQMTNDELMDNLTEYVCRNEIVRRFGMILAHYPGMGNLTYDDMSQQYAEEGMAEAMADYDASIAALFEE
ncbi:MAG: hypothetical protein MR940_04085 [Lachnospiraceae bacterium]|jgi:hypothetical protein|nr:hypothetical protein [Lachnospiraceae bacterium]MCI7092960.1 hypothetical protein [Lachnospiraceae bacterium]